jgi:hypothetical protein
MARKYQLPQEVNILGFPYSISEVSEEESPNALGTCNGDEYAITIRGGLNTLCTADTLLHEVLHGILACQGRQEDEETEERFVRSLATGLVSVLKNNPEFGRWLLSTIQTKT